MPPVAAARVATVSTASNTEPNQLGSGGGAVRLTSASVGVGTVAAQGEEAAGELHVEARPASAHAPAVGPGAGGLQAEIAALRAEVTECKADAAAALDAAEGRRVAEVRIQTNCALAR